MRRSTKKAGRVSLAKLAEQLGVETPQMERLESAWEKQSHDNFVWVSEHVDQNAFAGLREAYQATLDNGTPIPDSVRKAFVGSLAKLSQSDLAGLAYGLITESMYAEEIGEQLRAR